MRDESCLIIFAIGDGTENLFLCQLCKRYATWKTRRDALRYTTHFSFDLSGADVRGHQNNQLHDFG